MQVVCCPRRQGLDDITHSTPDHFDGSDSSKHSDGRQERSDKIYVHNKSLITAPANFLSLRNGILFPRNGISSALEASIYEVLEDYSMYT